ncbi:MAG: response regulator [Spirochaetales bacterium]|nr:response regulator [Spirochaetales bacterium]
MKDLNDKLLQSKSIAPFGIDKNAQPLRVCVIDDTFIDRRMMTQILRSAGFAIVAEAGDGREGLSLIEETEPQIVILDYIMPKLNGLETLKAIKEGFPQVKVVMSTSESERDVALNLMKEGADDYIVKPLDRATILYKMKKIVDGINY